MEVKLITGSFVVRLSSGESVGFIVEVCSDILTDFRLCGLLQDHPSGRIV